MSVGLIALLDDIAALAKAAAASLDDIAAHASKAAASSLDDVAAHASKAGAKAAGVVIDDAAVTPRYVIGFAPARELPIIGRIALGSLRNKLLILLPAALLLSAFLPAAITPLLMLGGLYLAYEGAEKLHGIFFPHAAHDEQPAPELTEGGAFEDAKVAGAVKTDFILSAEIMAITLGSVPDADLTTQAVVLAVVGIAITIGVYGVVALIVKADDIGLAMAQWTGRSPFSALGRVIGRGLVIGMPWFLKLLGIVGTAAMIWVGGGIILHGLDGYGLSGPSRLLHDLGAAAAAALPALGGFAAWVVQALGAGIAGVIIGFAVILAMHYVIGPAWELVEGMRRPRQH